MNFDKFTIKSQNAVDEAIKLVQQNGQQQIETAHLFKAIQKEGEDVVSFLLGKMGTNVNALNTVIDSKINTYPRVSGAEPYL